MFKNIPLNSSLGESPRSPSRIPLLILLVVGVCAFTSASVGYWLGDEAIKGVAQPEENPLQRLNLPVQPTMKGGESQPTVKFVPLNAEQVVKDTKAYIKKKQKNSRSAQTDSGKKASNPKSVPED
jgi:hypothetical protein